MPQHDVVGTLVEIEHLRQRDLEAAILRARALYNSACTTIDRIHTGVVLADCLSRRGQQDAAETLLSRLSMLASGNPCYEAAVLCQLARIDSHRGLFTQMLRRAVQARARAREGGDRRLEARCLSMIATAYDVLGVPEESMQCRIDELLIWQHLRQPAPIASLDRLAGLYHRLGRHEDAVAVAARCLIRCLDEGNRHMEAQVRCTRAQCLSALNRPAEAEADLMTGRDLFAAVGAPEEVIRQEVLLGELLTAQGRFDEATAALSRARMALQEESSPRLEVEILAAQARLAEAEGEDAVERFSRALAWFENLQMGPEMAEMHDVLYRIHKRAGRWKDALTHHEALLAVRGALVGGRSEARMDALRVRYEVTQLEQERRISHLRNVELAAAYQRLQTLATQDPVTGLFNRRHLDTRLAEEHQRAKRYGRTLSLVVFDIDHFKGINDGFGHAVGDQVLQAVAKLLLQHTREADIAARHGGDEFAVLFPDTELDGARKAAGKIRQIIDDHDWSGIAEGLCVTISGGVAELSGDASLMEVADQELYASKRAGRNRISG